VKPVLAALASITLVAAPAAASAQHNHGGGHFSGGTGSGWHSGGGGNWRGGGSWAGGGWRGGSGGWAGGWRGGGFRGHDRGCWGCFGGGLAFGLALGSAWDPWYWDAPYYGYPAYTVIERGDAYPDDGYYYDRYNREYDAAPPPSSYAAPAAPACGSWQWDAGRQQYNWLPCAVPPPPPPPAD
jgi:hypothetical protein